MRNEAKAGVRNGVILESLQTENERFDGDQTSRCKSDNGTSA